MKQAGRFTGRNMDFVKSPQIRLIPSSYYTEENLEATLRAGEREEYETDFIMKNGAAGHLLLALLTP
jgi:hypothetical protein